MRHDSTGRFCDLRRAGVPADIAHVASGSRLSAYRPVDGVVAPLGILLQSDVVVEWVPEPAVPEGIAFEDTRDLSDGTVTRPWGCP